MHLVTGMVIRIHRAAGVMGREYAKLDGEAPEVALGIYEHYLPRFAGDELPTTDIGRLTGIADKLDNICATFQPRSGSDRLSGSVCIAPSGSWHHQHSAGRQLPCIFQYKVIAGALYLLNIPAEDTKKLVPQIAEFMKQRLRNMLMDQGIRYDVVDAVPPTR